MMHDELHALLPDAVYTALDANAHLPAEKRFKLQEACKKSSTSALYDPATGAPFGHQLQLTLAEGAHFDPVKRGLALAIAGRSAGSDSSTAASLIEATGRRSVLLEFRTHWASIEAEFGGAHELSGTNVDRLWEGVSFVMQARAARATAWGCPEVELACKEQFEAIPAYRAAVATSVSRAATALPARDAARSVNSAYLSFFLPFWWEHVLLRSRLEDTEAARVSKEILSRPPPPPYVPPAPPPPPAQAAPRPQARPPAPGQAPRPGGFLGKPISPLIVGNNIGLAIPSFNKGCLCAVSIAYPGRTHRPFECPIRYHASLGACPGWTAGGVRIPACWNGDDLTDACRAEWRTFAQVLPHSQVCQGAEVAF
jgi:hypothetical protein